MVFTPGERLDQRGDNMSQTQTQTQITELEREIRRRVQARADEWTERDRIDRIVDSIISIMQLSKYEPQIYIDYLKHEVKVSRWRETFWGFSDYTLDTNEFHITPESDVYSPDNIIFNIVQGLDVVRLPEAKRVLREDGEAGVGYEHPINRIRSALFVDALRVLFGDDNVIEITIRPNYEQTYKYLHAQCHHAHFALVKPRGVPGLQDDEVLLFPLYTSDQDND